MRKKQGILLSLVILSSLIFSGCWNYREVDELAIVSGIAVDKGYDDEITMTLEIVGFTNEKETRISSEIVTLKGKTIFDAARNGISVLGKKIYWSHLKVVIISEQVAREGVIKVVDWVNRDAETRSDANILICKGCLAKDVLVVPGKTNEIKSFRMQEIVDNERNLSKAPNIDILDFSNLLAGKGTVAIAPSVTLKNVDKGVVPQIFGTAVFKKDKLVCFLDGEETKDMLFVQNEIKGGVLVDAETHNNKNTLLSLEIFKNKTKIKPIAQDGEINFIVNIDTITAIDEVQGTVDFVDDGNRKKIEKSVASIRSKRIENLIKKMQDDYSADIFGFGEKLREDELKVWKNFDNDWEKKFRDIHVAVNMNVHIRNSATLSKPLELGD